MLAGVGAIGRVGRHGISGGAKRPSFSVDFVDGGGSLGAGAVFTRASPGWYTNASGTLVSAAVDAPRFDYDPVTLQLKGLLLEDASTNLVQASANVFSGFWGKFGNISAPPVAVVNQVAAPDGTVTAARVDYPAVSAAGAYSIVSQGFTAVLGQQYGVSIWARGVVGGEQIYLCTGGAVTARLRVTLTTQWQRFGFVTPAVIAGSLQYEVGTDLRDTSQTSTPAQSVYLWGGQCEATPYVSSYIPTSNGGGTATRARDALAYPVASVTGFDATKGTLAHEYILEGAKLSFGAMAQLIGSNAGTDYISVDEITTAGGSTGTIPMISGASIAAGGTNQSFTQYSAGTMPTPAGPVHRGATSWQIGAPIISAHDATGGGGVPTPVAAIPVIANLTIAGPMHFQSPISQWARRIRYWPRQLSQAELISATTLDGPTLSLDFMSDGTLDPRITFARASSATYTDANGVVRTVTTNAPRWDYANGVLRGLLIEEQRTNLALQSGDLNNAVWSKVNGPSTVGNAAVAPDGTLTAASVSLLAVPSAPNVCAVRQQITATAAPYTFSIWMKGTVGGEQLYLYATPDAVTYYRQRFTLTTSWQRFSLTTGNLTAVGWFFSIGADLRDASQTPTAAQTIFAWGAQVEQGAFPTSYIPTTNASVTRAIENVSMPIGPWFSTAASTLYAEFQFPRLTTTGLSAHDVVSLEGNQNALTIRAMEGPSSNASIRTYNFGLAGLANLAGTMTIAPAKIAAAWGAARGAGSYRGNAVGSYAAGLPINMNALIIGNASVDNNSVLGGWVRRVLYWNRALSDTELQQVTT